MPKDSPLARRHEHLRATEERKAYVLEVTLENASARTADALIRAFRDTLEGFEVDFKIRETKGDIDHDIDAGQAREEAGEADQDPSGS